MARIRVAEPGLDPVMRGGGGFTATIQAAATIISAGRVLDAAMLEQTARRTLQTTDNTATSMDLTRYDRFMHDDKETNG